MSGMTRPTTGAARDRVARRVRVVTGWTGSLATGLAVGLGILFAHDTAIAQTATSADAGPDPVPGAGVPATSDPAVPDPPTGSAAPTGKPRAAVPRVTAPHTTAPHTTAPHTNAPKAPATAPKSSSGGAVHGSSGGS